jgi:hypothetical protein
MVRHIVLFKFRDPSDVAEAASRLQTLVGQIPSLLSLEVGENVRDHPIAWQLALVTTHEDLAGLMAYQEHVVHQEFVEWLNPRVSARAVVDHY